MASGVWVSRTQKHHLRKNRMRSTLASAAPLFASMGGGFPLHYQSVRDVLAGRLAGPHNLHDLAAVQPVVSRDGVVLLDARQLRLPQLVPL